MMILQINAIYHFCSTGRTCEELHDYLKSHGITCITAYGEQQGDYEDTIYVGNYIDHKAHAFLSRLTGLIGYFSYLPTLKLLYYIRKHTPDIIQLRNLHSNFINIPMLLSYCGRKNIPVVVNLHDCFWFTGKCCHFTAVKCRKYRDRCGACPIFRKWNKVWFFDRTPKMMEDKIRLFHRIDRLAVIGVAQWVVKEAHLSSPFKDASIVKCIYNWVDQGVFKQASSDIRSRLKLDGKFVILCIASVLDASKGLDDMVKVAKQLSAESCMLLVGKVNSDTPLPENMICYGGTTSKTELAQLYSCADVLLQLSVEETCSKVMVEAISCGTPIVVYDSTCGPELAENNCGCVVKDIGNIAEIVSCLNVIRQNGKLYYSNDCIKKAHAMFNMDTNCAEYVKLYEELIAMKPQKKE